MPKSGNLLARLTRARRAKTPLDVLRSTALLDPAWYRESHPDLRGRPFDAAKHYLEYGAADGRNPGPHFDTKWYLRQNPDVAASGVNPLVHYVLHGEHKGLAPHPPATNAQTSAVNGHPYERVIAAAEPPANPNEVAGPAIKPSQPVLNVHSAPHAASPRDARSPAFVRRPPSLFYVSGEAHTPGHQYRIVRYMDAATAHGCEVAWARLEDISDNLKEIARYDILILWRVLWNEHVQIAIDLMHSLGRKVVFDVDDLMIDPNLAKVEIIDGIRTQSLIEEQVNYHYALVRQTMLATDVCFAATERLAFHMRSAGMVSYVLPNGFSQEAHDRSRMAARKWRAEARDSFIRIGYAGGSRTHQRDLELAIHAVANILREYDNCRLVLFREFEGTKRPLIDIEEYECLAGIENRVEWRPLLPLSELPEEMARFDINLAPLEIGNPFCEAKSELKFFEAALVGVPTIASPTAPFRWAIEHRKSGFLAINTTDWYAYLKELVESTELRANVGREAYHASLAKFGPMQRAEKFGRVIDSLHGGLSEARAFALEAHLARSRDCRPIIGDSDVIFKQDRFARVDVTVIVPLYNYSQYVKETLDSVANQSLSPLDLVIIDGCSTDDSLAVATAWASTNAERFNRLIVIKNRQNYGLAYCRNSGFDAADTQFVLPLDADNKLRPNCCELLLKTIKGTSAAYVYPIIQRFGGATELMGTSPYSPQNLVPDNYIDAMALVSKEAWAMIGGYNHIRSGWEDYDFWSRMAENGLRGVSCPEILADYRVHPTSMMATQTLIPENRRTMQDTFVSRHPWVSLSADETALIQPRITVSSSIKNVERLQALLPILRCPVSKQKLALIEEGASLCSSDTLRRWRIIDGRPILSRNLKEPKIFPADHISNELPESALSLIHQTNGPVLNMSAGGSREKFEHVIEVEYAIFRHTDVVADAHELPFDDDVFELVIAMNAFEHYSHPAAAAAEIYRVLKPGGRVLIRTAFLQPLHERPWHFYNTTRYGLSEWFKSFQVNQLHVSDNFSPNYSLCWLASELESSLQADVSNEAAKQFSSTPIQRLIDMWRDPSERISPLWTVFKKLSQPSQEVTAAGFELMAQKPQFSLETLQGKAR